MMSSNKHQALHYLVWTLLNVTVVLFSIALSFDIICAVDDRSKRAGAIAEYLFYIVGTSVLWVVEVTLTTYEKWKSNNFDWSSERKSILMVEWFASLYFVYGSIHLLIQWKLHKEDVNETLFEVVVNILSYSYLSVSSFQAYYKASRALPQQREQYEQIHPTRNQKYDIHPDFATFPVVTVNFHNTALLWFLNTVMRTHGFFVRRAFQLRVNVDDHLIPRADGSHLKVFTIAPQSHNPKTLLVPAPVLIYYYGSAFATTYGNQHLKNCARYANETGCIVVFVLYRLAPHHPFPDGFDDCYASIEWVTTHAERLGLDVNRIAVGGDSAGGALAAGVAQKSRDEELVTLCAQLLIYPVLDHTCSTPSATDFIDVPVWTAHSNQHMWDMYLRRYQDKDATTTTPVYAAPGQTSNLHHLPRTYVETAEFDPLRDEGLNYVAALQRVGIAVTVNETKQTVHGYDAMEKSDISQRSMRARIAFLNQAFSASSDNKYYSAAT